MFTINRKTEDEKKIFVLIISLWYVITQLSKINSYSVCVYIYISKCFEHK